MLRSKRGIAILTAVVLACCAALLVRVYLTRQAAASATAQESDGVETIGWYGRVLDARLDPDDLYLVSENDASAGSLDTDIPIEKTLVSTSVEIDDMVQAELDSGAYTWDAPLAIVDPYQNAPLSGLILFDTDQPCRVRVTVKGKTEAADLSGELPEATAHRVPVIGLYPGEETAVLLELLDGAGSVIQSQQIAMQADALPKSLEDMVQTVQCSGESAFGLIVVYGQGCSRPFAYDCNGDIRWYLNHPVGNYGMYVLSNGRLIAQDGMGYTHNYEKPQATNLYELDLLGRYWRMYYLANGTHHEVIEKEPGGNLLCLTSTLEDHFEDEIVELDRQTGAIVNELELIDLFGETYTKKLDWAHINTVSYNADDDTILISCRNLHSVIKIGWTDHDIKWILCDPEFWKDTDFSQYVLKPVGDFHWAYQQHTAYALEADLDGNPDTLEISLFDNHTKNYRPLKSYDGLEDSYAKVFSVDEGAKTVTLLKELKVLRSTITSNVIYDDDSGHIFAMCGFVPADLWDGRRGMLYEMDYDTGEVLNQFSIRQTLYRASEMPVNYGDLAAPMDVVENYITGTLKQAVATEKTVDVPDKTLEAEEVSLKLVGRVLYVEALDHTISQVILKGAAHTYVYDAGSIAQHFDKYQEVSVPMPIPLQGLEADDYRVLVVYKDELYDTGKHVKP